VIKAHLSPIGDDNDRWLAAAARQAGVIVAGWGVGGTHVGRDRAVIGLFGRRLSCLRRTKGGHPAHLLYLPKDLTPIAFKTAIRRERGSESPGCLRPGLDVASRQLLQGSRDRAAVR
jgi:hypothetical protein